MRWCQDPARNDAIRATATESYSAFRFAVCPEDLIVAKLLAYQARSTRYMDLDDIHQILVGGGSIELSYLKARMQKYNVDFPAHVKANLPAELKLALKLRKT